MSASDRVPAPRPELAGLEPYRTPDVEGVCARLHANESAWAVPKAVRKAIERAARRAAPYPDSSSAALRKVVSERLGVPADRIVTGPGADSLVDMLTRAFGGPGRPVVDCPPTFEMYRFYASLAGSPVLDAPRSDDFSVDAGAVFSTASSGGAVMVFVCSPNNPDGGVVGRDAVKRLLRLPSLIVLDEAYIEFSAARSMVCEAASCENLVVLRTFSKWAGLAGLRIGYAVAPKAVCEALLRVRPPYPVSSVSEAAAVAAIGQAALLDRLAARTAAARERLRTELGRVSFLRVLPGEGNFLLCETSGLPASHVVEHLRRRGIAVRGFDGGRLRNFMRVTVGTRRERGLLVRALRELEAGYAGENRRDP